MTVSGLSRARTPRVLDLTHSPVGLWVFDGDLTDETGNDDLTLNAGVLQYTASHEPGLQAARFRDISVRLLGAAPAPAALRITGDVTVEVVCFMDTSMATDTFGSLIFCCCGPGGNGAANQNALWGLTFTGLFGTDRLVPQFFWENSEVYEYIDDSTFTLPLGQWYHIVGVRESEGGGLSTGRLYVNGQLIVEETGHPDPTDGALSRITAGRDTNNVGGGQLGTVYSSAKVVPRALTAREVLGEYQYVIGERATPEISPLGPIQMPADFPGAMFSGDATDVAFFTPPEIQEVNNKVTSGLPQLTAFFGTGFGPNQTTANSKTVFHCGAGAGLDCLQSTADLSNFIQDDEWHVFSVILFNPQAPEAEDPAYQHLLFGGWNDATTGGEFALTAHLDGATRYAQGFANNGSTDVTVRDTLDHPTIVFHLVEYWNDGAGQMGIRIDDRSPITTAWTGNVPAGTPGMANVVRVGSVNFEGGWDQTTNVMGELHVFNQFQTGDARAAIRSYLGSLGYGFSV